MIRLALLVDATGISAHRHIQLTTGSYAPLRTDGDDKFSCDAGLGLASGWNLNVRESLTVNAYHGGGHAEKQSLIAPYS